MNNEIKRIEAKCHEMNRKRHGDVGNVNDFSIHHPFTIKIKNFVYLQLLSLLSFYYIFSYSHRAVDFAVIFRRFIQITQIKASL